MSRKIVIFLLVLGLAILGGAAGLRAATGTPDTTADTIGGAFSLTDQNGKTVTDSDFRGRLMLVEFGYTACPNICPQQLELIRVALDSLGDKAKKIAPIFVTLDPDHDTPGHLHDYLAVFSNHEPAFTGLTGPMKNIDDMARRYHIYYQKNFAPGTGDVLSVDHSIALFLMDKNGDFIRTFTGPSPGELTAGLNDALNHM